MIRITKYDSAREIVPHQYRIANQLVEFDFEVNALSSYLVKEPLPDEKLRDEKTALQILNEEVSSAVLLEQANAQLQYQGRAPFADRIRQIECWRRADKLQINRADELQINIDGQAICRVDFGTSHIHLLSSGGYDDVMHLEVLTGPALILLLAELGVYCLHAGAVQTPSGIIALVAESGVGKSTLSASDGLQWRQVADDILPVARVAHAAESEFGVLPFPQLKLANHAPDYFPENLGSIKLIIRLSGQASSSIDFEPISNTQAMLEVIRHTVAAKLFNFQQMQEHMDFAKALATQSSLIQLRYPRDLTQVSSVRHAIRDYLGE